MLFFQHLTTLFERAVAFRHAGLQSDNMDPGTVQIALHSREFGCAAVHILPEHVNVFGICTFPLLEAPDVVVLVGNDGLLGCSIPRCL